MSDDTVRGLRLSVNTGDSEDKVKRLKKELDGLGESGKTAQDGMEKVGEKGRRMGDDVDAGGKKVVRSSKEQNDAIDKLLRSVDPLAGKLASLGRQQRALQTAFSKGLIERDTFEHYNSIIEKASNADFNRLIASIDPAKAALQRLMETADALKFHLQEGELSSSQYDAYAAKVSRAMSEIRSSSSEAGRQIDVLRSKYDPLTKRMQELAREKSDLDKHLANRDIGIEEHSRLTKAIDSQTEALRRQDKQMGSNVLSAGQLKMANQMLPAQFTDIAVSLQGGQRPLTVLLQQGGQIKDMYGGVGQAMKAMGSYVVGLINPVTISAAALAGLAYAAYSAETRFSALNKQMIISGHSSQEEMAAMQAAAVNMTSAIHGISEATAGDAIATVAANGKIAFSDLNEVATVALEMQRSTGQEIADTAKEYASLGEGGEKALLKLNEKYNFLDEAQFRHLSGLYRIGKETQAANEAQELYTKNLQRVAEEAEKNLTPLEKLWRSIKDEAVRAGQEMAVAMGFGSNLQKMKNDLARSSSSWTDAGYLFGTSGNQAHRMMLSAKIALGDGANEARAKGAAGVDHRDANDKIAKQNDLLEKNFTKQQKLNAERTKFANQLRDSGLTEDEVTRQLTQFDKNHAEKKHKRSGGHAAPGENMLERAREQGAALEAELQGLRSGVAQMSEADKALSKFEERVRTTRAKSKKDKGDLDFLKNEGAIRTQLQDNALAEEGVRIQKDLLKVVKEKEEAHKRALRDIEKINAATAVRRKTEGMGSVNAQRTAEIDGVYNDDKLSAEDAAKKVAALKDGYAQIDAAQANWHNGASAAWEDFRTKQLDVAGTLKSSMSSCFDSATDSLVNFVKTGELSFKSLLDTAADAAIRIGIQYAMIGAFGGGGGLFSGGGPVGAPVKRAGGGMVFGKGTTTSDSIPAMLSNNEFVVNAEATSKHRGLLEAINSGEMRQFAKGGAADGSDVSMSSNYNQGGVTFGDIHVHASSEEGGKEAAQGIMDEINRRLAESERNSKTYAQDAITRHTSRPGGIIYDAMKNRT